ncbi:MAG TPA: hypothetical protein VMB70_16120 [Terriglobia bacterium]|nr:hypothetical protein [Terriglobia bacterium]
MLPATCLWDRFPEQTHTFSSGAGVHRDVQEEFGETTRAIGFQNRPEPADARFWMPSKRKLVPAACAVKPDLILIGAGLDGMRNNVLGQFDITPLGFAAMTRVVVDLANELCQGRIVSVLEGGRSEAGI